MKRITLPIVLLLIGWTASANPSTGVSAAQLEAEMHAVGAHAVLLKYYDTPAWSASVMSGIRSAAPAWLTVAEKFHSVADGAASEDIGLALYEALGVAPLRVLPLLSRVYGGSFEELCNVSFEAELPKEGVSAYLQAIRTKLGAARTKKERAMAAACSRGLDHSQAAAAAKGLR